VVQNTGESHHEPQAMNANRSQRHSFVILFLLAMPYRVEAQTEAPKKVDADRLGMTCAQVLKMSSTEWIAYFGVTTKMDRSVRTVRAAASYGRCYEARTDDLARAVARSGKGPSKAAHADFDAFEAAVKNFTAKALVDAEPPANIEKQALATLYEDQFRYEFYQNYQAKGVRGPNAAKAPPPSPSAPPAKDATPASPGPPPASAPNDADAMTTAKNRFGELLGALPDDKLHELHGAFGEVLGLHALDEAMRFAVYRYAIFLLEPSGEDSTYPPPF